MKIEIEIPDEHIENCLSGAFEGGSNYWLARTKTIQPPGTDNDADACDRSSAPLVGGKVVCTLQEPFKKDGPIEYELTFATLYAGIKRMQEKNPYQFGLLIGEKDDATTHDVLLQFSLFGEEIYG